MDAVNGGGFDPARARRHIGARRRAHNTNAVRNGKSRPMKHRRSRSVINGRAAARALERGIPIVALKCGRSEAGARLTLSHTSSLAGEAALYGAAELTAR